MFSSIAYYFIKPEFYKEYINLSDYWSIINYITITNMLILGSNINIYISLLKYLIETTIYIVSVQFIKNLKTKIFYFK